ncbi:MAG: hypothetical protein AB7H66_09320 [Hyphomonadaceae bacterium]
MRVLLLSTAVSFALACAAPTAVAQDYGDMAAFEQSMAAAQAQASRPGDDQLSCEQLEGEMVSSMQDPAVQSAVAANGAHAQAQMDRMNEVQGQMRAQIATNIFMGIASSFIPGLGYAQMAQQQLQAAQYQQQAQQSMAERMQMIERVSAIMPQIMRGQRLYELGQAQQCAFVEQQAPQ